MKLLNKTIPVISFFSLILAVQALALPIAGDTVNMGSDITVPYTMTDITQSTSYQTFCLESGNVFYSNTNYFVTSVGDTAYGGGVSGSGGDMVNNETKWLYAAYMDGNVFGDDVNAQKVQNAIWYLEGELKGVAQDWTYILNNYYNKTNAFDNSGWTVVAVNLSTAMTGGADIQSQLVGTYAPVPEPATMLLFGTGLIGLAGMAQKRKQK